MPHQPALPDPQAAGMPARLTLLMAAACGLIAANIYYPQPLAGPISAALGLSPQAAGLVVTMTQLGYGAGLLLVVPLGDLVETRRLVLAVIGVGTAALLAAACATAALPFLLAALLIGIGSVSVQVLVPYAAHLAPEAARGRVVGNVMSGLNLGIMLARPVASLVAAVASWHAVFALSAAVMVLLGVVLRAALPRRQPAPGLRYLPLLASMGPIARHTPVLQRRALYQSCMFGAFSLFWTTVPLLLAQGCHLSQVGIAGFGLAGAAGAVAAPLAGRAADRGWSRPATGLAMLAAAAAFLMSRLGGLEPPAEVALLAAAAILLDFGVAGSMVLGQRAIFSLGPERRSRLNGLYMATFFAAGAAGSAVGAWAFARGGWPLSSAIGLVLPVLALCCYATERRPGPALGPLKAKI